MIRINLLPQAGKKGAPEVGNQVWLGAYMLGVLLLAGGLAFLYLQLEAERDELVEQNQLIQKQIAEVKAEGGNLDEVKAKLERSKKLEQVVTELLDARSGPARMLLEMSNILTPGEGPSIDPEQMAKLRRANPEAGFTPRWDTRRLWVQSFKESNRNCAIRGSGKNNEDVAEFLRRLELSKLFDQVTLRSTQASSGRGVALIDFHLDCKVLY